MPILCFKRYPTSFKFKSCIRLKGAITPYTFCTWLAVLENGDDLIPVTWQPLDQMEDVDWVDNIGCDVSGGHNHAVNAFRIVYCPRISMKFFCICKLLFNVKKLLHVVYIIIKTPCVFLRIMRFGYISIVKVYWS